MKPLMLQIILVAISIAKIEAKSLETDVQFADEDQQIDGNGFDQISQSSYYNEIVKEFKDMNHDYIKTQFKNINYAEKNDLPFSSSEEAGEEPPPNSEIEEVFPYELYSKVKVTLPANKPNEQHVIKTVLYDKPIPVKILIEKPFPLEKHVPVYYPIKIEKPVAVNKYVRFPVKVEVPVKKRYPVYRDIPVPVPVYVEKPVPKFVEKPYPVPVFRNKEEDDVKATDDEHTS